MFISAELFKDGKFSNPRNPEGKREVREVQDKLDEMEKFLIKLHESNPVENFYKKVKDPNLVGSLGGYAEGSRAFARYHTIDDDMKKELVGLLE